MNEYKTETFRIEWRVEFGTADGFETGYWIATDESIPFPTKEEAEAFLNNHPDVYYSPWGNIRSRRSYGLVRVRRHMEKIDG